MNAESAFFMKMAIQESINGMRNGKGGPFGTVIVKEGKVIAAASNEVTSTNDPTAHAEVVAIRKACKALKSHQLEGCEIYTSCEPCPMCMGAIYWARPSKVFYANTKVDAALAGFDDQFIEKEFLLPLSERKIPMEQLLHNEALLAFKEWVDKKDKEDY